MNKILKGMNIVSVMLGCTLNAGAQDNQTAGQETRKEGFMKRAFRDMKESALLQRQIDKANYQAVKLETKAFYQEQKRKGYKAVENGVTSGYQAVEDAFVEAFTDTVTASRMYRKQYRADIELSWSNPDTWGISLIPSLPSVSSPEWSEG